MIHREIREIGEKIHTVERGAWGHKFPTVVASWRRAWPHVIPFFAFPPEIRRDTTNALVHARSGKSSKPAGTF